MRGPKWWPCDEPGRREPQACGTVDSRDSERVLVGEVGQDPRKPPCQHRLARTRRPHKEHVVPPGSGDLQGTARLTL